MGLYGRFSSAIRGSFLPTTINDPQTAIDAEIHYVLYKCLVKIMLWVWNKVKQRTPDEDQAVRCSLFPNRPCTGLRHALVGQFLLCLSHTI
jgi:hypothetical protein